MYVSQNILLPPPPSIGPISCYTCIMFLPHQVFCKCFLPLPFFIFSYCSTTLTFSTWSTTTTFSTRTTTSAFTYSSFPHNCNLHLPLLEHNCRLQLLLLEHNCDIHLLLLQQNCRRINQSNKPKRHKFTKIAGHGLR